MDVLLQSINENPVINRWMQSSPVCHQIFDPDFKLRFMSNSGVVALQIENVEDYYGHVFPTDSAPKITRDIFNENMFRATKGETNTIEYSFEVGGLVIWYRTTISPFFNVDDNLEYIKADSMDITSTKKTEERFRQLAENTEDVFWMEDIAGREIIYISPAFDRIWGISRDKLYKNPRLWMDSIHPDDNSKIIDLALYENRQYLIERKHKAEFRIVCPDGTVRWILDRAFPVFNDCGELVRIAGISQDITDRKLAEGKLKEAHDRLEVRIEERTRELKDANLKLGEEAVERQRNEERFDISVKGSTDGLWDWSDMVGGNVWWSPRFYELLGYENNEFAMSFAKFVSFLHPEDEERVKEAVRAHLEGHVPYDIEYRLRTKSGESRWFRARGQATWDQNGKPQRMSGSVQDVTDRKKLEDAAKESEELLKGIVNNSSAVIYLKDLNGRYILVNQQYEVLFKLKNEEVQGKTDFEIFPKEFAEAFVSNDRKVIETKSVIKIEEFAPHDDYVHTYISIKFPMLAQDGAIIGVGGISTDITERKKMEDELRVHRESLQKMVDEKTHDVVIAKEQAENANKAKSEFLSRMSHELRTPMNAILGFTQLLGMDSMNLTDIQKENLSRISSAGYHLLELINEVLDLSKIESGNMTISIEPVDIVPIVDNVISILGPLTKENDISLEYNKVSGGSCFAEVDSLRFKQIIMNLVSNAIKYNKPNGSVVVSYEKQENGVIRVGVRDTNYGITDDKKDKIFKPFERFGINVEAIEGTGIGLTISKKLIELMNGSIGFESKEGEGSFFYIDLPLADKTSLPA
ncbi:MAG: PAS domain S-box protein [Nitrospinaceae bacterium]|nr:PAS domain S-box protein [Nitrospinaceae bacterium]